MSLVRRAVLAVTASLGALVLVAGPVSAAPNEQDREFLVAAHQGNLAEIAAGQAAQQKATTDTVRALGQMLITDHQTLDAQVVATAQQLGVTLPGEPSPAQQAELARVAANTGQAFDNAWIASQIAAHRQTLALGERELANGAEPTVKALATAAAPVVQHHLDEALAAAQQFGVPTSVPAGSGGQAAVPGDALGLGVAAAGLLLVVTSALVLVRRQRA
jgi:putative membrane protein